MSPSDLVWKQELFCNLHMLKWSERLIIIHIKEYIKRTAIMKELYGL